MSGTNWVDGFDGFEYGHKIDSESRVAAHRYRLLLDLWEDERQWLRPASAANRGWRWKLELRGLPTNAPLASKAYYIASQLRRSGFMGPDPNNVQSDIWKTFFWDFDLFAEALMLFEEVYETKGIDMTDTFNEALDVLYDFGDQERVIVKVEGLAE